jgi:hypothetical protein
MSTRRTLAVVLAGVAVLWVTGGADGATLTAAGLLARSRPEIPTLRDMRLRGPVRHAGRPAPRRRLFTHRPRVRRLRS